MRLIFSAFIFFIASCSGGGGSSGGAPVPPKNKTPAPDDGSQPAPAPVSVRTGDGYEMMPSGTLAIGVSLKTELNYAPGAVLDTSDVDISAGLKTSDVLVLQYTVGGLIPEVGPAGVRGVMALRNVRVLGELVPECEGMAQCPAAGIFNPNVLRGSVSFRPTSAMASWWRNAMPLSLFRLTTMAPVLSFEVSSADSSAPVMPWSGTEGVPLSDKFFVSVIDDAGSGSGDDGSGGENPPPPPQPAPYFTLSRSAGTQSNVYGQPVEFFLKVGNFLTPPEILCDLPAGLTLSDDKTLISGVILDSFLVRCVARLGETLAASSEILSVAVEPKPVEASIYVRDKTYDGATTVLQSHCLISAEDIVRPEDDVTCGLSSASFPGSQEGLYSLSASDMSIASFGAHARLYDVRFTGSVEALILARRLEVFWYAMDKQYDGTRLASYGYTLDGLLSGDEANVSASSVLFSDASPGPDKRIDIYGVAVDNRNYFVSPEATATASIAKRKLTAARPGNVAVAQYSWDDVVFVPYFEGFVEGESPLPVNVAEIRYVVTPLSSVTCEAPFSDGGFCQVSFDPATLPYFENYELPDSGPAGGFLYISDVTPPFVLSVSATPDGVSLKAGAQVLVGVTFSENVDVVGAPTLRIATAPGVSRTLNYDAGLSTPDTLIFPYTVQAGDNIDPMDADELVTVFGESFIADRAGLPADLGLSSYQGLTLASSGVILDTTAPSITYLSISPASPGNSQTPQITINLSEAASSIQLFSDGSCGSSASTDSTGATGAKIITTSSLTADATTALYAKATDIAGNVSSCSPMTSYTHDGAAPTVTSVTSPIADGTYGLGQLIPVTVAFSETVYVTGTPQLTLATGGAGTAVNYTSGSGTNTLTFNYTVVEGHGSSDLDYTFFVFALALNGGTIVDGSNNGATLSLPIPGAAGSLGANKAIVIDTTAPLAPNIVDASKSFNAGFNATILQNATTDVNFKEFRYTLDGTTTPNCTTGTASSALPTIVAIPGATTTLKVVSCDLVGNLSGVTTAVYTFDNVGPTFTSLDWLNDADNGFISDGERTNTTPLVGNLVQTDSVTTTYKLVTSATTCASVLGYGDIPLSNSGDFGVDGNYKVCIKLVDATGNITYAATATNVQLDTVAPTVTSVNSSTANGHYKLGGTVSIQVNFSENVTVDGPPTLALNSGATLSGVAESGPNVLTNVLTFTYTVGATQNSTDLDYSAIGSLTAGTSIKDAAGNNAVLTLAAPGAATSLGANKAIVIDTTPPAEPQILGGSRDFMPDQQTGVMRVEITSSDMTANDFDGFYYTTDGSVPSCGTSAKTSSGVDIAAYGTTLKVRACDLAGNMSTVAEAFYSLYVPLAKITDQTLETFPDTSAYPAVSWVPKISLSVDLDSRVSLFAASSGGYAFHVFNPASASSRNNMTREALQSMLADPVAVYAEVGAAPRAQLGSYKTNYPASFYFAGTNGNINAVARDTVSSGCDDVYPCFVVGGSFTAAGGTAASLIARYKASDGTWSQVGGGITGSSVDALLMVGSDLYVGGSFSKAGTVSASNIAKWDGSSWSALGSGTTGTVKSLANINLSILVGGQFSSAGGRSGSSRIAVWSDGIWSTLGTGITGSGTSSVNAIAYIEPYIYAGGNFTSAGGVAANNIAYWDGSTWQAMGAGANSTLYSFAANGTDLYVGGAFTTIAGVTVNRVAKWTGSSSSWSALGSGIGSGNVQSVVADGGSVYAGGTFPSAGGVTASNVARWNGSAWSSMGGTVTGSVSRLAAAGSGSVYLFGQMTTVGGLPASYAAKWNGSSLAPLAESRAVMGALTATAVDNKSPGCSEREPCLYVAGYFKTIGNITTNNIARYKTSDGTWSALGTGIGDGMVNSLSVSDSGDLYAGGSFSTMGGVAASRVAKWNGSAWSALGTGVNSVVYVVHAAGGNVYAGGDFTSAGGLSASRVAKWTGSDWQALGTGVNSSVYALAADASGQVWAGGDFTSAGGSAASRIARWDGSSWQAAGTGMSASVRALVIAGGELYAGGAFTSAGGLSANRVAKWNGSAWSALGTGVNSVVYGLASSGSKIYAAGTFTGGFSANRIASWDGSAWTSLGGGLNGDAVSVSTSGGNLYAGGYFDTAGGKLRPYLARWVEAFEDWH